MSSTETFFNGAPSVVDSAPGRVNLLGEHTDYNDGFMLPIATPQRTTVAVAPSNDDHFHFYSSTLGSGISFARHHHAPPGFGSYVEGCIRMLEEEGIEVPPVRLHVSTELPVGSGMSSSAALEVATLRALRRMIGFELDDVRLAQLAQQAEIRYAKVNCGIMDQMASSLADQQHMLFVDARTLDFRVLPVPEGCELIVIDSGVPRTLAGSKYNERRAECNEAARMLGVDALRDVTDPRLTDSLPSPLRERARHVVTEDLRVLEACEGVSPERFGQLMNDSHTSLRNDYAVSVPALDVLVGAMRNQAGVLGARLTGAGFGGACVALCRQGKTAEAAAAALREYDAAGYHGQQLIPPPMFEKIEGNDE